MGDGGDAKRAVPDEHSRRRAEQGVGAEATVKLRRVVGQREHETRALEARLRGRPDDDDAVRPLPCRRLGAVDQ